VARSEKEQARLAAALRRFKFNTAVFSVLVVLWLLRSADSLGALSVACAALAVGALLVGLHVHEARSLAAARKTADKLHSRVSSVAQQVADLLERRETARSQNNHQKRHQQKSREQASNTNRAGNVDLTNDNGASRNVGDEAELETLETLSLHGSVGDETASQFSHASRSSAMQHRRSSSRSSAQTMTPSSPAPTSERVFSIRSFGNWSLRSSRSGRSGSSDNDASSTDSRKSKRRTIVSRVFSRSKRKGSRGSASRTSSLNEETRIHASASEPRLYNPNDSMDDEQRSRPQPVHTTKSQGVSQLDLEDDEVEENKSLSPQSIEDNSKNEIPAEFKITDDVQVPMDDINQPPSRHGIEELKAMISDVMTPEVEYKYGGPIRAYERYLLARECNVSSAEKMLRDSIKFRKGHGLDDPDSEETKLRMDTFKRLRSLWVGEFLDESSYDGSPIQVFRYKSLKPRELMKSVTEEEFADFYITWMDMTLDIQNRANSKQFQALCQRQQQEKQGSSPSASTAQGSSSSLNTGKPYDWKSFIEIHDLSGLGLSQLHMPGILMLTRVLKVGQGHYPENLRVAYIVNAPFLFAGAWKVISKVLDPATVEKINVSANVPRDKISQYIDPSVVDKIFPSS